MKKFDIEKAIEEETPEEEAGREPLDPQEFKKIRRAISPGKKLIRKTIEERIEALRRKIKEKPQSSGR